MGVITLPTNGSVYLDAATIIYGMEKHSRYVGLIDPLWRASEYNQVALYTSELSLLETMVAPLRRNDLQLIRAYETLFNGTELHRLPISLPILRSAAEIRASSGLKTADAIHAASALGTRCDLFVTNDPHFRKLTSLPLVVLDDLV